MIIIILLSTPRRDFLYVQNQASVLYVIVAANTHRCATINPFSMYVVCTLLWVFLMVYYGLFGYA